MTFFPILAEHGAIVTQWDAPGTITINLVAIVVLVLLNGFFVAAEFALVKVRGSQLDPLVEEGHAVAIRAKHIIGHLDAYLSATQFGVTLASLALGWVGEDYFTRLLEPLFLKEHWASAAYGGVALLVGVVVALVGTLLITRTDAVADLAAGAQS